MPLLSPLSAELWGPGTPEEAGGGGGDEGEGELGVGEEWVGVGLLPRLWQFANGIAMCSDMLRACAFQVKTSPQVVANMWNVFLLILCNAVLLVTPVW